MSPYRQDADEPHEHCMPWRRDPTTGGRSRPTICSTKHRSICEQSMLHPQGPVLLTQADLAAMLSLDTVQVSKLLKAARQATGKPLLTKDYYFDQGMRPTHKDQIIALYEAGLDEADIARQSQHQPTSVGKYIRHYERVKLLLKNQNSTERIVYLTGMQPNVVMAYIGMVYQNHPDLTPEQVSPAQT